MSRIFALLIGIDNYKSGNIWNLHSCVEDAKKMKCWLTDDLDVPKNQIRILLDSHATKQSIEDLFMEHLVNNPIIERNDAIIFYFAGHGSSLPAPAGWSHPKQATGKVNILCPYDHDTRTSHGRNAGISDRSLISLVEELIVSKGDNITVILDCCFSPTQTSANIRDRHLTRWTKTVKAVPDDLYSGLWNSARGKPLARGLFNAMAPYTLLAACPPGEKALEGKEGGKFTTAFLHAATSIPLHRTSYAGLMDQLLQSNGDSQKFVCLGKNKNRNLFDDIPFTTDIRFQPAFYSDDIVKVQFGAIHGVVQGTSLSLHMHNHRCSINPPIAHCIVTDVHPTFSFARPKSQLSSIPTTSWAKVTQWNNPCPFKVYLKSTFLSFLRMWKLLKLIPCKPRNATLGNGVRIQRVSSEDMADLSVKMASKSVFLVQNKPIISEHEDRGIEIDGMDGIQIIDDAAKFNFHLVHKNAENPFQNLVDIEIHRLDPVEWTKISPNYLQNGIAVIPHQRGALYSITLHNSSNVDMWPYLLYMDPTRFSSVLLYNPDPLCKEAPLPCHGRLDIGATKLGPEESAIALDEKNDLDFAYIKGFFSTSPVNLSSLERQSSSQWFGDMQPTSARQAAELNSRSLAWDTALVSLIFTRYPEISKNDR